MASRAKKTPRHKRQAPARFPLKVPPVEIADWEINRKSSESEDECERATGMTEDELLALDFLQGRPTGKLGDGKWLWQPSTFLTGEKHTEALEALLRLLASKKPMAAFLRQALIDGFAVTDLDERQLTWRRLKGAPRRKRDWAIPYKVNEALEKQKIEHPEQKPKISAAVVTVANRFGLSEKTIWNVLTGNKKSSQKIK
jgi:hypothetical protein